MGIDRISTYGAHQRSLRDFNQVTERLANTQNQISSGYKSADFAGLNGQVEQLSSLEAKIKKNINYKDNNAIIETRLQTTNNALDQIIETGTRIKNLISQRRAPNGDVAFSQQLNALKDQLASALNTNVEGRYVFSGSRTDAPAVIIPIPQTNRIGVPDASYYQGSAADLKARLDDDLEVTYNIRADETGFQKLFASVFQALQGDGNGSDAALSSAYALAEQGVENIIQAQGKVNANLVNIQQVNDKHENLSTYWRGLTEQISHTDLVVASTQVAVDQATLQASFQTFARLINLRLSDFLK